MTKASIALLSAIAFLALAAPAQAGPLIANTSPASEVSDQTAVLNGHAKGVGVSYYYFEYGTSTGYGAHTADTLLAVESDAVAGITGLVPATLYHFRLVTKASSEVLRGTDQTFTTAGYPDLGTSSPLDPLAGSPPVGAPTGADPATGATVDPPGGDASTGSGAHEGNRGEASATAANPPVLGQTVGATPDSGSIRVKPPGATDFVSLERGVPLPVGTTVDARRGSVDVVTAAGGSGLGQTATFRGAIFQIRQGPSSAGMTDIYMRGGDFAACRQVPARAKARVSAARARGLVRRLWGRDHGGRWRTHGRGAIATVRGTTWAVTDRCDGTLTRVRDGAVSVRDKRRHRTVLVRAGHSYLARSSG
jgi:hypothetical protein